jgi:HD-like signal output (HDOD) protein
LSLGLAGTTHAEIGAFFLDLWGLPGSLVETSLYHHEPDGRRENDQDMLWVCRIADLLSNYVALHPDATKEERPPFLEKCTEKDRIYDLIPVLKEKYEHLAGDV